MGAAGGEKEQQAFIVPSCRQTCPAIAKTETPGGERRRGHWRRGPSAVGIVDRVNPVLVQALMIHGR